MQLQSNINFNNIIYYLIALCISSVYFSFAIPNILLGFIVFLYIFVLFTKKTKLGFSKAKIKMYILISVPFLLTFISVLNSHKIVWSFKFLWTRLPVLLIPLVILNLEQIELKKLRKISLAFVISSAIATLIAFFNALKIYLEHKSFFDPNLTKEHITLIQHPYFGIYVLIALITLYHFKLYQGRKIIRYTLIILLIFGVVLSTSRIAILLLLSYIFYTIITSLALKKFVYYIIIIGGIFLTGLLGFTNPVFKEKIVNTFSYWDSPRAWLWNNSYKILKYSNHKLRGVGIGDYYRIKRSPKMFIHSQKGTYGYNPHNQYLEFLILNGILGFLYLFAMLYLLYFCYNKKNKFSFFVVLIISVFSFTECIFNRQYGVQLYAFFIPIAILLISNKTFNPQK